jgi:hypothetical protein
MQLWSNTKKVVGMPRLQDTQLLKNKDFGNK